MVINLYNKDCIEVLKDMKDNEVDLCLTDPPYGLNIKYNTYNDSLENWYNLMLKFIPEAKRVSRMLVFPSCSINKLKWIYDNFPPDWLMAWHKGSYGHAAYIGFNDWEPLLVYGKLKEVYFHDVIKLGNTEKMGNYNHPCPKPIKWFDWFYTKLNKIENAKVMDCFMGSGTSAITAHNNNLDYIGIELDKEYFEAAKKRLKQHTNQQRLF